MDTKWLIILATGLVAKIVWDWFTNRNKTNNAIFNEKITEINKDIERLTTDMKDMGKKISNNHDDIIRLKSK